MKEKSVKTIPGIPMLLVVILLYGAALFAVIQGGNNNVPALIVSGVVGLLLASFLSIGFFIVEPNGSKVLLLFGKYIGTVKSEGFHFANPFFTKRPVSLRIRTLNGERLKVNDLSGNPIEIATVVVWQVRDTYDASFSVEDYEAYVMMQSETALRHSASIFPYDGDDETISLRQNTVEVADHLREELQERLAPAGVQILEARLSHLAYAPEIAGAMLRRQQAAAIIAARQKIVDGAVGMVEMALERLERDAVIKLDEDRKATMVSNLMVVLCSEQSAMPVLNTGTLHG